MFSDVVIYLSKSIILVLFLKLILIAREIQQHLGNGLM
ncbi:hypothetical protein FHS16_000907 [Paenibacillus endophyticus]|uniref:Uncharacterized protein n=1 Tax=Paenibacillus endophyticus TaxID=1294268 RepID=A0A7W5C443_9BACL|nr:hypothetical protein [Paenibacillus endophyticus]